MIDIAVLGHLTVSGKNGRRADLHTVRGSELFVFLVLEANRVFHRERLADQFWSHLPPHRGRKALNTEFWRVTGALRAIGMDIGAAFHRSKTEIGYRRQDSHAIDIDRLHAATDIAQSTDPADVDEAALKIVEDGVAVYRGDLLESVYSDWCLIWRESLRNQHTVALEFLLKAAMERKDWSAALARGRALLALDPLMEDVHRAVMRCHYHNGNRPLALRQYALCEQLLREDLGVEPMEETRRIQETILAVSPPPPAGTAPERIARSGPQRTPVQKVDMALSNINSARHWLEDASQDMRQDASERS